MNVSRTVITGAAALALVAGGTAAGAAIASGPVDSSGVIHGCYTNKADNGSHVFELQNAGTSCPKGTTAITWNQAGQRGATGSAGQAGPAGPTGPAGSQGAAGPTGDTGATGPQGPAGPAGPAGVNGNTVLNGTGAPASSLGNAGDFYLDTAASVLYGPKTAAGWPASGTSLAGPSGATGPQGPAGPAGPQGPAGPSGPTCSAPGPGANLANCQLTEKSLVGVNLAGADLAQADLENSNLSGADLVGADLAFATLNNTNLSHASLNGANLLGVELLQLPNITGAIFEDTTCPDGTNSNNDGNTCVGHGFL
jgi:hypothetical protein